MRSIAIRLAVISLLCLVASGTWAQSTPGFITGQVPTASQWNYYFSEKLDYQGGPANAIPYYTGNGSSNALVSGDCTSIAMAFTCTSSGGTPFGTAAFDNTGTSGATIPLNNGGFTQSGTVNFTSTFEVGGYAMTFPSTAQTLAGLSTAQTWAAAQKYTKNDFLLLGSSTGYTTLNSGLSSTGNNTLTLPTTSSDTLAALGTVQTFTAAQTFNTSDLIINGGSATAGLATVTSGGVVSSEAFATVAQGGTNCSNASGTCLDNITGFSGTGVVSRTGAGTYTFGAAPQLHDQIITSGTSWTSPSGITTSTVFLVTLVGGGGSGYAGSGSIFGQGGGSGCGLRFQVTGLSPSTAYTVAIGSAAGNTTFSNGTVTETAGGGATSTSNTVPGAGGTCTFNSGTGLTQLETVAGQTPWYTPWGNSNASGPGGDAPFGYGKGGAPVQAMTAGASGTGYGSGGSGGYGGDGGGSGASGIIDIQWVQ